ncbi:MAG: helix-turn-helix transcriptional regulator [Clostridia bacterium]|nr:helix-turn-helix transcriptional regulator [Clostridia bacterium]
MNLKDLRKNKGLTQQDLANELGISRMKYNHYELGNSEPNISMLIKLADLYKVTLDELVGHKVPYLLNKVDFSSEQLEVIDQLKALDKNQCKNVSAYIKGLRDGKER